MGKKKAKNKVIYGTEFGEEITGTDGKDKIVGLGGDDTIEGGAGNDQIWERRQNPRQLNSVAAYRRPNRIGRWAAPCTQIATGLDERAGRWLGTSKCGGECGIHTKPLLVATT